MLKTIALAALLLTGAPAIAAHSFTASFDFEAPFNNGHFTSNGVTIGTNNYGNGAVTAFYNSYPVDYGYAAVKFEFDASAATGWFGWTRAFPMYAPGDEQTGSFVAGHNVVNLTRGLSSFYFGTYGIATIDNLTITFQAVPEPTSWMMLITGFAGVGVAMRRRAKALTLGQ